MTNVHLNSLIEIKPIYEEKSNCLVCGNDNLEEVYTRKNYTISNRTSRLTMDLNYQLCPKCGLVFMNPLLAQSCRNEHMRSMGFATMDGVPSLDECENWFRRNELDYLRRYLPENAKALEVGSGDGHIIYYLKHAIGCDIVGIDLSDVHIAYTQKSLGLNTFYSSFEDFEDTDKSYDLIISKHVFEHFLDPLAAIQKARKLLKDDGTFVLVVPSVDSATFTLRDMFSSHNYLFSDQPLRTLLIRTGFEIIQSDDNGYELFYILRKAQPKADYFSSSIEQVRLSLDKSLGEYKKYCDNIIDNMRTHVTQWIKEKKRIVIFGAGEHTFSVLELFDLSKCELLFLVDSNPVLRHKEKYGYKVFHPDDLLVKDFDILLISSNQFQEEMVLQMEDLGFSDKIFRMYPI